MESSDLRFNVLSFSPKEEGYTFYFTDREEEGLSRFYKTQVPAEVIQHFGKQDHYYTTFDEPQDGFLPVTKSASILWELVPLESGVGFPEPVKNSAFSLAVLKAFFNYKIFWFFKSKNLLVKPNYIKATEVWIASNAQYPSHPYKYFDKFTLKVQWKVATQGFELLLSYDGRSKIFKIPEPDFLNNYEVSTDVFSWMVYNRALYKYHLLPEAARREPHLVYPVWNFQISQAIQEPAKAPDRGNRYQKFYEAITGFYNAYLNTEDFKALMALNSDGFVQVSKSKTGGVNQHSNRLLFGNQHSEISPLNGVREYGPYDLSPAGKITFFFIYHKDDEEAAKTVDAFLRFGTGRLKGLTALIKTPYATIKNSRIVFQDRENPWPEIYKAVTDRAFPSDVQHFAIYLSPISKNTSHTQRKKIYYRIKELLLNKRVLSQVVDAGKVLNNKSFHLYLPNIAIAILAKLNGTPWRLDTILKKELVVGVGAYKSTLAGVQYIASAFSFSNTGKFNRFECFRQNQTRELAGSIIRAVKDYVSINEGISRLIIHFFKDMSRKEYLPIEEGLNRLNLDIPAFIVSINKTESRDIVAFDLNWKNLIPHSGTFINLGRGEYLLFNNTRYLNNGFRESEGFPFPIKLRLSCNEPELAGDHKTVRELIDQVYQFSRMYWKSVSQQNLPVTIKYPEIVAEMFPHFEGNEIPDFGKDRLWFL